MSMFGLNIFQVLVILFVVGYMAWDTNGPQMMLLTNLGASVIYGVVLGNVPLALNIGATLSLMSLGVVGLGGASVPDYGITTVIAIIVAVKQGGNVEAGLAVGLPVGMLYMYLDVLQKLACGVFARKQEEAIDRLDDKAIDFWADMGTITAVAKKVLPVAIVILFGQPVVEALIKFMPDWLYKSLGLAGKLLPVTGMAILMNYMPLKRHLTYFLIGFVCFAYLGIPTIGVGIVGVALAYKYWLDHQYDGQAASAQGGMEDE